jgi:CheY-like chemotaxis protein
VKKVAKILVVEDDQELSRMLAQRLRDEGNQVESVTNGQTALDRMEDWAPDLVITDFAMPLMTGNLLVRALKESEKFRHIPVIMLSAFMNGPSGESGEVPADAYIQKPFEDDHLMDTVLTLLKGQNPKE